MTNYQQLCCCIDIQAAASNPRFCAALTDGRLNEAVNRHIFYPNTECLADLACALLPAQNDRIIIHSVNDRWFHTRFRNWDAAIWVYCPAQCNLTVPVNPNHIKITGPDITRGQVLALLEKDYAS